MRKNSKTLPDFVESLPSQQTIPAKVEQGEEVAIICCFLRNYEAESITNNLI